MRNHRHCLIINVWLYFLGPGDEGAQEYDFGNYNTLLYSSKENYKTVLQKPQQGV